MSRTFSCAPIRRRMATQNRHLFQSQSIVLSNGFNFNNNFQRYLPSSSSCSATPWRSQQQVWRNSWKHLLKINPTLLRQFPTLSSLGSNTCVPKNGKPCEYLAIFLILYQYLHFQARLGQHVPPFHQPLEPRHALKAKAEYDWGGLLRVQGCTKNEMKKF